MKTDLMYMKDQLERARTALWKGSSAAAADAVMRAQDALERLIESNEDATTSEVAGGEADADGRLAKRADAVSGKAYKQLSELKAKLEAVKARDGKEVP